MAHKVKKPKKVAVKKTAVKRKSAFDKRTERSFLEASGALAPHTVKEQAVVLMTSLAALHFNDRDAVYRELRKLLKRVIKNK
jgi:hypothetical protein